MKEMKTLNGYEVVDTQARADIEQVRSEIPSLTGYATEEYVNTAINNIPTPSGTEYEMSYLGYNYGNSKNDVTVSYTSSNVVYWTLLVKETSSSKIECSYPVVPGSTVDPSDKIDINSSTDSVIDITIPKNTYNISVHCWAFRKKD